MPHPEVLEMILIDRRKANNIPREEMQKMIQEIQRETFEEK